MKVLIGIPSTEDVKADFATSLAGLVAYTLSTAREIQLGVFNAKGCHTDRNRHYIIREAQKLDARFLLFLDADMVFPPTLLLKLLAGGKDVTGCDYPRRVQPFNTLAMGMDGLPLDRNRKGLVEVSRMPTGTMLLDMAVLAEIGDPPWFENHHLEEDKFSNGDYTFCDRARAKGIQLFCDLDLSREIGYIGTEIFRWSEENTKSS